MRGHIELASLYLVVPGTIFLPDVWLPAHSAVEVALTWSARAGILWQKPTDVNKRKASNTNLAEEATLIELPAHGILSPPIVHHGNPFLHFPQDLGALALRPHILQGHACSCLTCEEQRAWAWQA